MTKRSRQIAFATLLLACVLLPVGFFFHGNDEGDTHSDHHHCVICCPTHHGAIASAVAAPAEVLSAAAGPAPVVSRGIGPFATLGIRSPRGPPA